VLNVTDPQPLPNGIMAFGAINGLGFAYDDVAVSPAAGGPSAQMGVPIKGMQSATSAPAQAGPTAVLLDAKGAPAAQALDAEAIRQERIRRRDEEAAHPGQVGPPAPGRAVEDFEAVDLSNWDLGAAASIGRADGGQALVLSGPGQAYWNPAQVDDFVLRFRYRAGAGVGDVLLRNAGGTAQREAYHVRIGRDSLTLVRRAGEQERTLGTVATHLSPGEWYPVALRAGGGSFTIEVGNAVLTAQDPSPLPAGGMAFGCSSGDGCAYDDIILARVGKR
jgi:hypothetical protein